MARQRPTAPTARHPSRNRRRPRTRPRRPSRTSRDALRSPFVFPGEAGLDEQRELPFAAAVGVDAVLVEGVDVVVGAGLEAGFLVADADGPLFAVDLHLDAVVAAVERLDEAADGPLGAVVVLGIQDIPADLVRSGGGMVCFIDHPHRPPGRALLLESDSYSWSKGLSL